MALSEHFKADGSPKVAMSEKKAWDLSEELRSQGEDTTCYKCSFCFAWHIGHRS